MCHVIAPLGVIEKKRYTKVKKIRKTEREKNGGEGEEGLESRFTTNSSGVKSSASLTKNRRRRSLTSRPKRKSSDAALRKRHLLLNKKRVRKWQKTGTFVGRPLYGVTVGDCNQKRQVVLKNQGRGVQVGGKKDKMHLSRELLVGQYASYG